MNRKNAMGLAACLMLVPLASFTQENDPYIYATYFTCTPEHEARADEIINSSFKPHYDAAVEQGDITSWTWMQHYVGGVWRRALVIVAPDLNSVLDASGALGEIISESTPEAGRAFSAMCPSHVDYVWRPVGGASGTSVTQQRGAAGLSIYMECAMDEEERADELVREVFGLIYNQHLDDDGFTSWNWLSHEIGGKYRRLLIFGAPDHKQLMTARARVMEAMGTGRSQRAFREFNTICHTHEDYLWDILIQSP